MNLWHILIYIDIYVVLAMSLNLVVGYCGLMSLAHAGFYAIGSYAYALLSLKTGLGFFPALVGAVAFASLGSLLVSLPAWRLRGDFFVLASLAVQAAILSLLNNWTNSHAPLGSWQNLTNGPGGITKIPPPKIFGWTPADQPSYAAYASVVALVCLVVLWLLQRSPWGRLLRAMRDDELAARGLGKNTRLIKVQVVAVASGMAAIAGVVYAGHVRFVDPSMAGLDESILMLSMVVVGGLGNLRGPVLGAVILVALPEVLRYFHYPDAQASILKVMFIGFALIFLMHLRPQGIAGSYRIE